MPGFIEGHGHFMGIGENKMNLDLMRTTSWDEIVADGRAGGREGEARTVDHRPRLASGEVDLDSAAERRGISRRTRRSTRSRRTTRRAHACQRACVVRQREGDGAVRHHRDDGQSGRRRDPEGRERRSDGAAARDGVRDSCVEAPASRRRPPRRRKRARRRALELADQEVIAKGITSFQDAGLVVRGHQSHQADDRRRPDARAAVGDGARRRHATLAAGLGAAGSWDTAINRLTVRAIKAADRRRARLARRVAARAVLRQAGQLGPEHHVDRLRSRKRRRLAIEHNYQMAFMRSAIAPTARCSTSTRRRSRRTARTARPCAGASSTRSIWLPADIPRFGQLGVIASMQARACHVRRRLRARRGSAAGAPKKAPTSGRSS